MDADLYALRRRIADEMGQNMVPVIQMDSREYRFMPQNRIGAFKEGNPSSDAVGSTVATPTKHLSV